MTTTQIILPPSPAGPLAPTLEQAQARTDARQKAELLAQLALAPKTRQAYTSDWREWCTWCMSVAYDPLPAQDEQLAQWAAGLAGRVSFSTIGRRLAAVRTINRLAGYPAPDGPACRAVLQGVRNQFGAAERKAAPLTIDLLRLICDRLRPESIRDVRDRCALLLGWAGALRRSELGALRWQDAREQEGGLLLFLAWSKGDKARQGVLVPIPAGVHPATDPVRALQAWRRMLRRTHRPTDGAQPLLRGLSRQGTLRGRMPDSSICSMVKARIEQIGRDPKLYSGHSLRAGFITTAAQLGFSLGVIAEQSRHLDMNVLREYVRLGTALQNSPAGKVGL